jgi:GT2 family glycosyltransferase
VDISASIVLYKNEKALLKKAISSFLNTNLEVRLYLLDNSPNDSLRSLEKLDSRITYIFNKGNLGYGSAHNIAIKLLA